MAGRRAILSTPKIPSTAVPIGFSGGDAATPGMPYRAVNSSKLSSPCSLAFLALVLKRQGGGLATTGPGRRTKEAR